MRTRWLWLFLLGAVVLTAPAAACQTCHAVYRAQDPDTGEYLVNLAAGQPR